MSINCEESAMTATSRAEGHLKTCDLSGAVVAGCASLLLSKNHRRSNHGKTRRQ